jgi:hypothetical protein
MSEKILHCRNSAEKEGCVGRDNEEYCKGCGCGRYLPSNGASDDVQASISNVCADIAQFLIDKNRKYGNSALEPVRVFSKASNMEQLYVRMDDKIKRIMTSDPDDLEDAKLDLVGYLILEMVKKRLDNQS